MEAARDVLLTAATVAFTSWLSFSAIRKLVTFDVFVSTVWKPKALNHDLWKMLVLASCLAELSLPFVLFLPGLFMVSFVAFLALAFSVYGVAAIRAGRNCSCWIMGLDSPSSSRHLILRNLFGASLLMSTAFVDLRSGIVSLAPAAGLAPVALLLVIYLRASWRRTATLRYLGPAR